MKDGRRGFLGGAVAAGAAAVTYSPAKAIATQLLVPKELRETLANGSTGD